MWRTHLSQQPRGLRSWLNRFGRFLGTSNRHRHGIRSRNTASPVDVLLRGNSEDLEERLMLAGVSELEPNNVAGSATALTLIDDPAGSGMLTAFGTGAQDPAASGNTWSDPDYFSFTALAGDVVSVAVATPASDVDSYVELRNSADGVLASDNNSGADTDAFISHYTISTSGDYLVRIGKNSSSTITGDYQLRVDIARGINHESDAQYANDSIGGADLITFPNSTPGHALADVSGTIMATEGGTNTDEDFYSLGILDSGNIVNLSTQLPALSTLTGKVRVVDSSGTDVADDDGNPNDAGFSGDITVTDQYYAVVEATSGAGPLANYLLQIDIEDTVAPQVTSLTGLPDEGITSSEVISSLSLDFSERMDPSTVLAPGAFDLREKGPDNQFDTADDVIVDLVSQSNFTEFSTQMDFFLQSGPLANGDYRFTVSNTVTDRAINQLDGDGDGSGGDSFVRTFTLALPAAFVLEGPDNNVIGNATPLSLTEDPELSGYFTAFGLGSQDPANYADWWSDPDYWRFDAQAGDIVRVSIDTPNSSADPYVELRNASDGNLQSDNDGGPGTDVLTNGYTVPSDGTYYLRVGKYYYSTVVGSYQLRLDLARGQNLESDSSYSNDSSSSADPISLTTAGNTRLGSAVGAIMLPEGSNTDEDSYNLGYHTAGNVIELSLNLPDHSSLDGQLRLYDSSGVRVADADGNDTDGHFLATITADDTYYAQVRANSGAGLFGTYILNATITDAVPPTIQSVNRLPLPGPGGGRYSSEVLLESPSVYYRLNETSGTTVA
ncbi:MAG: pre-peptidase C-terminal domain-containing protein, partial [Fuerstiella sp.]